MKRLKYILLASGLINFYSCKEAPQENNTQSAQDKTEEVEAEVALSTLDKINDEIVANPMSPNGYYKRALYYKNEYNFDLALEDIDRALKVTPDVAELVYAKADIIFNKAGADQNPDMYAECLSTLEKAKELDSTHVDNLILLGRMHLANKNHEKAIAHFDQALRQNKNAANAYFWKGMTFEKLGKYEQAFSSYQTTIEQDPEHVSAYNHLGLLHANNFNEEGLNYYDLGLAVDPNSFELKRNKAFLLKDIERYDEAIALIRTLTNEDPMYAEGFYNIGNVFIASYRDNQDPVTQKSITDSAIFYFEKATQIAPEYLSAWFNHAHVNAFVGNKAVAISSYQKVLELDENHEEALAAINEL